MVISAQKLKKLIEKGEIQIQPFNPSQLKEVAYTFTLGTHFSILKKVEVIDGGNPAGFETESIPASGYVLHPGGFIVGYTQEKIILNHKYICLLSGRSTQAQMGLNVTQSSFLAEPDTEYIFALEISNKSGIPIRIFPGMKIAKGIFLEISS